MFSYTAGLSLYHRFHQYLSRIWWLSQKFPALNGRRPWLCLVTAQGIKALNWPVCHMYIYIRIYIFIYVQIVYHVSTGRYQQTIHSLPEKLSVFGTHESVNQIRWCEQQSLKISWTNKFQHGLAKTWAIHLYVYLANLQQANPVFLWMSQAVKAW